MAEFTYPQNLEAERALLGSILFDNSALALAIDRIEAQDFFKEAHQKIYTQMLAMLEAGRPIDLVTIWESLAGADLVEKVGGAAYISSLVDNCPFGAGPNILEYCRLLKEKANLRRIIGAAQRAINTASNPGLDASSAREVAEALFSELGEITLGETPSDLHTFREAAISLLGQFDRGPLPKILTGIERVDQITGGFLPGEMVLISAETTGSGKTLLAQQIRRVACSGGRHGIYFSAEMLKEQIAARELIAKSTVPGWKLRRPESLTKEEYQELARVSAAECEICSIMDGVMTMGRLAATARRVHARTPLHLAVIDYDELVVSSGRNENEELANVAKLAKQLSISLKIVVILISQVRKAQGGAPFNGPLIDKFFGSGAKTKHASCALLIDRPFTKRLEGDAAAATIWICKSRDSKAGPVQAKFDVHHLYFLDGDVGAVREPPAPEQRRDPKTKRLDRFDNELPDG